MDTNKETRENTLTSEESSSGVSEVRMPLVDALLKYFHGIPAIEKDVEIFSMKVPFEALCG